MDSDFVTKKQKTKTQSLTMFYNSHKSLKKKKKKKKLYKILVKISNQKKINK